MANENVAIGRPRSSTAQISATLPPTLQIGADAASPANCLPITRVAAFFARALGRVNIKKNRMLMLYGSRRPVTSDNGAKNNGLVLIIRVIEKTRRTR